MFSLPQGLLPSWPGPFPSSRGLFTYLQMAHASIVSQFPGRKPRVAGPSLPSEVASVDPSLDSSFFPSKHNGQSSVHIQHQVSVKLRPMKGLSVRACGETCHVNSHGLSDICPHFSNSDKPQIFTFLKQEAVSFLLSKRLEARVLSTAPARLFGTDKALDIGGWRVPTHFTACVLALILSAHFPDRSLGETAHRPFQR